VSFEIRFEGSVGVNQSQMRREGISVSRACIWKTTRGKSNVDTRLGGNI